MSTIIGLKLFFTGLVLVALGNLFADAIPKSSFWYRPLQLFGWSSVFMLVAGAMLAIWGL